MIASAASGHAKSRPGLWLGLFLASIAVIAVLKTSDAINPGTAYILMAGSFCLMLPFMMAMRRRGSACSSTAALRYTKGIAVSSALYVAGLGIAVWLDRNRELEGPLAFVIALLPTLPIFGMIWVMARYLREETDEYLRHLAMIGSLAGLALVLGVGSFWGFLETFDLVPHAPGWWAVPIWAIGMGLGRGIVTLRDRTGGEE